MIYVSDKFEWRVPHNEESLASALDLGNKLLQLLAEKRGVETTSLYQETEGDTARKFSLNIVYCQFAGSMTADRDEIIYSGKRPLAGMYFRSKAQEDLQMLVADHYRKEAASVAA